MYDPALIREKGSRIYLYNLRPDFFEAIEKGSQSLIAIATDYLSNEVYVLQDPKIWGDLLKAKRDKVLKDVELYSIKNDDLPQKQWSKEALKAKAITQSSGWQV